MATYLQCHRSDPVILEPSSSSPNIQHAFSQSKDSSITFICTTTIEAKASTSLSNATVTWRQMVQRRSVSLFCSDCQHTIAPQVTHQLQAPTPSRRQSFSWTRRQRPTCTPINDDKSFHNKMMSSRLTSKVLVCCSALVVLLSLAFLGHDVVSAFEVATRNSRMLSTRGRPKTHIQALTKQRRQHQQISHQRDNQQASHGMSSPSTWRLPMQASSSTLLTTTYPVRIAVMGGGNFGLAMASICSRKGYPTTILVRDEQIAMGINTQHRHPRYMQGVELPHRLRATSDPKECLPDATYIIHAVPCQYSRAFLEGVKKYIPPGAPILSVSKGIETTSLGFMADLLKDVLGEDRPLAFLSGPSFAREIVEGVATAVVIASEDLDLARDLAALISDGRFKCFTSTDVIGVEIGGAVKNVIALGAGMCEGLGLGTNAMSGLVTRGCNEMRRLGLTFGARPSTIAGLSGERFRATSVKGLLESVGPCHSSFLSYCPASRDRSMS